MNLDPDILAGIKAALRLNPQGATPTDLSARLGTDRETVVSHLEFLTRNGDVRMKFHDQSGIHTLSQSVLGPAMLRLCDGMYVMLDANRRVVQMNDSFRDLCDEDGDEMLGRGIGGLAEQLVADLPIGEFLDHPAEQALRTFIRFIQENGEDRFFQIKMLPWPFEDGTWGVVVMIEDSTSRRSAELALAECQHTFREVLQNIQDVFYRSDTNGNLVMASDSLARLLGYDSIDECIGRNAAEAFYLNPEDRSEMLTHLRRDGAVWNYEVVLKRKNGTPVPVSMNSHLVYSPEGTELGVEGIFRDISEQKAAHDCIHQHAEKIVDLSRDLLEAIDHPKRPLPSACV